MKKVFIIGLAMVLAVGMLAGCGGEEEPQATYKDGTYTAVSNTPETERVYTGFDGYIEVTITISDDVVTDVSFTEYDAFGEAKDYATYGREGVFDGNDLKEAHEALANAIIEANSWDVDAVTGATSTSKKAIEAAERAFEMALVEPASDNVYFDGTFMGRTQPDSRGSWLVAWVTIQDDKIVDVVFGETYDSDSGWKEYEDYGVEDRYTGDDLKEAHEALAAAMVEANSAEVDAVSGSTGTSEKAVEAVKNALAAAKR